MMGDSVSDFYDSKQLKAQKHRRSRNQPRTSDGRYRYRSAYDKINLRSSKSSRRGLIRHFSNTVEDLTSHDVSKRYTVSWDWFVHPRRNDAVYVGPLIKCDKPKPIIIPKFIPKPIQLPLMTPSSMYDIIKKLFDAQIYCYEFDCNYTEFSHIWEHRNRVDVKINKSVGEVSVWYEHKRRFFQERLCPYLNPTLLTTLRSRFELANYQECIKRSRDDSRFKILYPTESKHLYYVNIWQLRSILRHDDEFIVETSTDETDFTFGGSKAVSMNDHQEDDDHTTFIMSKILRHSTPIKLYDGAHVDQNNFYLSQTFTSK